MAANSALHYAAGISVPGCQLRRNLVTKSPKTIIMASNPAMPSETNTLVSMPPQLQRNSMCTRRNKTIVAAYPDLKIHVTTIVTPGVPEYTNVSLENHCSHALKLDDKNFWEGSQSAFPPKEIGPGDFRDFQHHAGSGGSIGALEYVLQQDGCKLIVAWSNAKDDLNKVYTAFLEGDANWHEIKEKLDISGNICIFSGPEHNLPHSSTVYIDKTSPTPTLRAIVKNGAPAPFPFDDSLAVDSSADKTNGAQPGVGQATGGIAATATALS